MVKFAFGGGVLVKMRRPAFLALCVLLLAGSSCDGPQAPDRGPRHPAEPTIALKASYISVPVSADINRLTELALEEVTNPVSSGTDEVDAEVSLMLMKAISREVEKRSTKLRNEVRRERHKVGDRCRKILGSLFSKLICEPVFTIVEVAVQVPHEVIEIVTEVTDTLVREVRTTKVRVKHEASVSSLSIGLQGDRVTVTGDIDFWLQLGLKEEYLSSIRATVDGIASCGINEPLSRVRVEISGTISADAAANLAFNRESDKITWLRECKLTAAKVNLSDILRLPVIEKAFEKAVTKGLDKLPSNYKLRPSIEQAWSQMQQPLTLADGLTLQINPRNVGLLPIQGTSGILTAGASVEFSPVAYLGKEPEPTGIPLPDKLQAVGNPGEFNLLLKGKVALAALSARLLQELKRQDVVVAGRQIEFTEIELYGGTGGEIVIAVGIRKPARVTLYLVGKPVVDPDARTVKFTDVDYSVATRNWLVKSADFLLHRTFVKELERKAEFDFDPVTVKALQRIARFDEKVGPGMLTGTTNTLRAEDVRVGGEYLHLYISATGTAAYKLQM